MGKRACIVCKSIKDAPDIEGDFTSHGLCSEVCLEIYEKWATESVGMLTLQQMYERRIHEKVLAERLRKPRG